MPRRHGASVQRSARRKASARRAKAIARWESRSDQGSKAVKRTSDVLLMSDRTEAETDWLHLAVTAELEVNP
jgi:hypothetical protein